LATSTATAIWTGPLRWLEITRSGLLRDGDGTWNIPEIVALKGSGPVGLAAVDLRGSAKLDLVVAEANTSTVGVLLGNGDGTFQPEVDYPLPTKPESIITGDFNNGGKPDVVVGNIGTVGIGPVSFLAGDGTGKLGSAVYSRVQLITGGLSLAAGDLNRDGKLDLLISGDDYGGVQVALGNGDGTFSQGPQVITPGLTPSQGPPLLGDVDHDGCLDTVIFRQTGTATLFDGTRGGLSLNLRTRRGFLANGNAWRITISDKGCFVWHLGDL